jgi:hypothetical protein
MKIQRGLKHGQYGRMVFLAREKQYLRRFPEVGTTEVWQYGRGAISC